MPTLSKKHQHDVQFYSSLNELYRSVGELVRTRLQAGWGVMVCLTKAHALALEQTLRESGFAVDQLCTSGQLTIFDSHQTLAVILHRGIPDAQIFNDLLGSAVDKVRKNFTNVQIYGEMVDVLWERGDKTLALRLEDLWNAFIEAKGVWLHCAYNLCHFKAADAESEFRSVCACHAAVVPTEHYMTLPLADRLRYVAELQQKAASLEATRQAAILNLQRCKKLEAAKDRANEANAAKSGFVAAVSHEIRAPIGIIYGFSELMADPALTVAERSSYAGAIMRNAEHLAKLVDDILDLAKVEAGKLNIERQVFLLPNILSDVIDSFRKKAEAKNIDLSLAYDGKHDLRVYSDTNRLRQILVNVIGNAVKFTGRGKVSIAIEEERFDNERLVHITVQDSGCGITKEASRHLFQPFTQADHATAQTYGGTGLGLLLARDMARLLGGDVVLAASQPGLGSTFKISIDAGSADEVAAADRPSVKERCGDHAVDAQLGGLRVLYADDMPDSRALVGHILTRHGATVDTVVNGAEAVSKASEVNYDIILMDLQMPILNGYDATIQLRSNGFQNPIIALTAGCFSDESPSGVDAGCDYYLTKPFSQQELISTLVAAQPPRQQVARAWSH